MICARKMKYVKSRGEDQAPEIIDMGMVGEITAVNTGILFIIMKSEFIPVIAPVGTGDEGETYNINADLVAGAVASSLNARKLVLLTDTEGVLDKERTLISSLKADEARALIGEGDHRWWDDPQGELLPERPGRWRPKGPHHRRAHSPRHPFGDFDKG